MMEPLPDDADVLKSIERFCDENALKPSKFGRLAIGDGSLVNGLRNNRSLTLKSARKIANFMADYRPSAEAGR